MTAMRLQENDPMTEPSPTPQATVKQGRHVGFSYIWLAPVIAAAVGVFLFYKSEIDVGPTITITFEDGARISNTAKLVYRGVQVGAVQSVELDASLGKVNVKAQLNKSATGLAREGSQFWVVEPRVSLEKISGLSTLLSGSYIQVAPGSGPPAKKFAGLSEPPIVAAGQKDLPLTLEADDAGSLTVGAPVIYRGIMVGEITAVTLPDDGSTVRIGVAIGPKHAALVRANTVFWRASGIQVHLNPLDPTIDIGSLASLIRGGIGFATPPEAGEAASADAVFRLLDDPPESVKIGPPPEGLKLVLTTRRAGISDDAPVYYRKLQVGKVLKSRLNRYASAVEIELLIEPQHARLVNSNSVFWNASGVQMDLDLTDPKIDIESLKALLVGGIAFATRGAAGGRVRDGATFALLDREPRREQVDATPAGRRFVLVADEPGSIAERDPVYYRQVQIGQVGDIELLPDGSAVAVYIYVQDKHAALVRERSVFWNVSGIHANLNLFDPSIDVESAEALLRGGIAFATPTDGGKPAAADAEFRLYSESEGRKRVQPKETGLRVVLNANQLGSVEVGDSVYYREVEVGKVVATGFEDNSASVRIHAVVGKRYAPLVKEGSVFWNASGLHADFSLFKGASLDVESLKALLEGGIAFATPENKAGAQAADGSRFLLHAKPKDEWLSWKPAIRLGPPEAEPPLPNIKKAEDGFPVKGMASALYTATTTSHVRQGPGTGYPIIEILAKDTTVEVIGRAKGLNWYRIRLADGGVGYVWGKLLQPANQ
jgi:paraquat-inducible protein B